MTRLLFRRRRLPLIPKPEPSPLCLYRDLKAGYWFYSMSSCPTVPRRVLNDSWSQLYWTPITLTGLKLLDPDELVWKVDQPVWPQPAG